MNAAAKNLGFAAMMTTEELVKTLERANAAYREGKPFMSDAVYDDEFLAELRLREPSHPFLHSVEAEPFKKTIIGGLVVHANAMKSTDKVYELDEVERWVKKVESAAYKIGVSPVLFRLTAKLDGLAGKKSGGVMATRGDGEKGSNVSHVFERGIHLLNSAHDGVGEIVVEKAYFNKFLADDFEHPRNFITGAIMADIPNNHAIEAFKNKAIHFADYESIENRMVNSSELLARLDELCDELESSSPYDVDGTIIEVMDGDIRLEMGSTSHHHCWQVAKKRRSETASAVVKNVVWQIGKGGRVSPVIEIEPVKLSGANISRITAHHAANVKKNGIGAGAEILISRSGLVIPKLERTLKPSLSVHIPDRCPSCNVRTVMEGDFLMCKNLSCDARGIAKLSHFFSTIGTADLFGEKTLERLIDNNYRTLLSIYTMSLSDFMSCGFSQKQSENLMSELSRSLTTEINDWRFLGAFGIHHLGKGDSRRILEKVELDNLGGITPDVIKSIDGFGEKTATSIAGDLQTMWPTIKAMMDLGFCLKRTGQSSNNAGGALSGLNVVFTGSLSLSREEMQEEARKYGAAIQSSVNKKTNLLVAGKNVGESKINAASSLGVSVVNEDEYRAMLKG